MPREKNKIKSISFIMNMIIWVILSIAGLVISALLSYWMNLFLDPSFHAFFDCWSISCIGPVDITNNVSKVIIRPLGTMIMHNIVMNTIFGLMVGAFQWFAIRRNGISIVKWIVSSIVGFQLSCWIIILYEYSLYNKENANLAINFSAMEIFLFYLCMVISFVSLGVCQWFILRKNFRQSGWWILSTTIGYYLGWELTWMNNNYTLPVDFVFNKMKNFNYLFNEIFPISLLYNMPYDIGNAIIFGLCLGFFSGIVYACWNIRKGVH